MTARVSLLDEASHTVRLAAGSDEEGIRKGNNARPAAAMVPMGTSAVDRKAASGRSRSTGATAAARIAIAPATQGPVPVSHPPGTRPTLLSMGLDGPSRIAALVMA